MKIKIYCIVLCIISIIFGLEYLFATNAMMALGGWKVPLSLSALFALRFAGACLLGWAVLFWLSRNNTITEFRRILIAFIVVNLLFLLIILYGFFVASTFTSMVWGNIVIIVVLTIWSFILLGSKE